MKTSVKTNVFNLLKIVTAFTPWVISMYTLYWLEYGGIWHPETMHRDKFTLIILVVGMGLSFLVGSHFSAVKKKPTKH